MHQLQATTNVHHTQLFSQLMLSVRDLDSHEPLQLQRVMRICLAQFSQFLNVRVVLLVRCPTVRIMGLTLSEADLLCTTSTEAKFQPSIGSVLSWCFLLPTMLIYELQFAKTVDNFRIVCQLSVQPTMKKDFHAKAMRLL